MTRMLISSGSPFEKTVGYSRAVVQGDWCFVAGTTGYDPETRAMPEDVRDQAKNALAIVERALVEGGFQLADVVRATYYITDMAYWDAIGPVLGKIFGRSEEHTSELQSLMRISYAVFCWTKKIVHI